MPTLTPVPKNPDPAIAPTPRAGALSRVEPGAPAAVADAEASVPAPPRPRTSEALQEQLDRVLAHADTSLRFRVDEVAQKVVVSVLDGKGEVVMQIPDEAALNVARRLARTGSLLAERA